MEGTNSFGGQRRVELAKPSWRFVGVLFPVSLPASLASWEGERAIASAEDRGQTNSGKKNPMRQGARCLSPLSRDLLRSLDLVDLAHSHNPCKSGRKSVPENTKDLHRPRPFESTEPFNLTWEGRAVHSIGFTKQ